jgi:hypothetical protein
MPIAKNLFDWGQRQFIAIIKLYYSDSYEFHKKMPKTKCQKIDGGFDHPLVKMCRIIQQNFIDFSKET